MSQSKLVKWDELQRQVRAAQRSGQKVVFTNGCFDLLHPGHIRMLRAARQLGDRLVIGVNADESVRANKGANRPIQLELERAEVLAALEAVDWVTIFGQETPLELIVCVQPDVLVKGADWALDEIVGRQEVEQRGGNVVPIAFESGFSTSLLIERVQKLFC